jgi:hypothetical protein
MRVLGSHVDGGAACEYEHLLAEGYQLDLHTSGTSAFLPSQQTYFGRRLLPPTRDN